MIKPITTENASEHQPHKWSAFASDLELPVGEWPTNLETTLGNGMPFHLTALDHGNAFYRQLCGCIILTVFND